MKKEKEINVKKKEKNDIWGTADRSRQLPAGGKEREFKADWVFKLGVRWR